MVAPVIAREGCWVGGLTQEGFAVQCRNDSASSQAATLTVEVFTNEAMTDEDTGYSSSSAVLATGHHFRDTVYVTGLASNKKYWWRVKLVEVASPNDVTYGTLATFGAGKLKTLSSTQINWKIGFMGCTPHNALFYDNTATFVAYNWDSIKNESFLMLMHHGDIYYSDIGAQTVGYSDYAEGHFAFPSSDVDATAAKYRTNFINTYSLMTYNGATITNGPNRSASLYNAMARVKSEVPQLMMWDDHDRVENDCGGHDDLGAGAELDRWDRARDVGHECYMSLNKSYIDAESGRTFTAYSSEDHYFYLDVPPARIIMLDCRSHRDTKGTADSSSKTMLGATQKAWLKARIDDNEQKYLIISNGIMFDGNHGWNKSAPPSADGWVGYSYERDEILDYIWANGDAARTIFLVGDTHEAGVFKFMGPEDKNEPIYEIMFGNAGWPGSYHGFVDGLKGGDSGLGGVMEAMFTNVIGYTKVEHISNNLKISMVCSHSPVKGGIGKTTLWSRIFK